MSQGILVDFGKNFLSNEFEGEAVKWFIIGSSQSEDTILDALINYNEELTYADISSYIITAPTATDLIKTDEAGILTFQITPPSTGYAKWLYAIGTVDSSNNLLGYVLLPKQEMTAGLYGKIEWKFPITSTPHDIVFITPDYIGDALSDKKTDKLGISTTATSQNQATIEMVCPLVSKYEKEILHFLGQDDLNYRFKQNITVEVFKKPQHSLNQQNPYFKYNILFDGNINNTKIKLIDKENDSFIDKFSLRVSTVFPDIGEDYQSTPLKKVKIYAQSDCPQRAVWNILITSNTTPMIIGGAELTSETYPMSKIGLTPDSTVGVVGSLAVVETKIYAPVGSVMAFATRNFVNGFLKLDGTKVLKADYPDLWNWAKNSNMIVGDYFDWFLPYAGTYTDFTIVSKRGYFQGVDDASTDFRVPLAEESFIGMLVANDGIGLRYESQNKEHTHQHIAGKHNTYDFGYVSSSPNLTDCDPGSIDDAAHIAETSISGGTVSRPQTISYNFFIKF